jgi:hypothetical protein
VFEWTVTDGDEPLVQEWDPIVTDLDGVWLFRTGASGSGQAPTSVADCVNRAEDATFDQRCPEDLDVGHSG